MTTEKTEVEISKADGACVETVSHSTSLELAGTEAGAPIVKAPLAGVERIRECRDYVEEQLRRVRENPENSYEKLLELIGEKAFDLMEQDEEPVALETLTDLAKIVVSVQGQRLKLRESYLGELKYRDEALERKEEEDDAKRPKGARGISKATQEEIRTTLKLM